ncbi:MAG: diaminopimelate epimerase [bacterium]|nr:diaminopimelate epimerase [bacterium]
MNRFPFWKLEGTGNDFILFDGMNESTRTQLLTLLTTERIVALCDRHFGVGADGIIVLTAGTLGKFRMNYWNADGSISQMCGNGLRCTAHFARLRGYHTETQVYVDLPSGEQCVEIETKDENIYCVAMPTAKFDRSSIPMTGIGDSRTTIAIGDRSFEGIGVNVGNPHFIVLTGVTSRTLAEKFGSIIETDPLFPEKINVEFAEVLNRTEVNLWVWERGCGITLACGSGATATAAALVKVGKLDADKPVSIHLPGGTLYVTVASNGETISMYGPAREVFAGEVDFDELKVGGS